MTTENKAKEVAIEDNILKCHFKDVMAVDTTLTRQLVSFQANKNRPFYRWYKYKEGFSHSLVSRFISGVQPITGKVLDPFAGSGVTLFTSADFGFDATGIELLPLGQELMKARISCTGHNALTILHSIERWVQHELWRQNEERVAFNTIGITSGAYSEATTISIEKYLSAIEKESPDVKQVLMFALLCVLESISFTRKDGQCLRWDYRSDHTTNPSRFDKGVIPDFDTAIRGKLSDIIEDMARINMPVSSNNPNLRKGSVDVIGGSCLDVLPGLPSCSFDAIITSPPYCNRYDYTRTYALEHVMLGADDNEIKRMRQEMLSCTVESRAKDILRFNRDWEQAISVCDNNRLLQNILACLEDMKVRKTLNNNGIPRMVRGYFYEMSCVIQECHRALRKGGRMVMVNDNVRYEGVSIPVDMILSKIAEDLGFSVKSILILPGSKGNSSQQMGKYGRLPLRKGVYVWEKPS